EHQGVHRFTVGQRKGLGVALGERTFVAAIEPATATVRLGKNEALAAKTAHVDDVVLAPGVSLPIDARVRVRYRHEGAMGRIEGNDRPAGATIAFANDVRAVSKGQVAVFYQGDRVLGGGT